ncbi:hypothetical protein KKF34_09885 [Myxococcota bacterium]|nr:hypothetical protein [Myxococcota bacterium]MBU1379673.1 hypothetical protein [Myxococcota bacterium]MBU1497175.1 hypothetical protein [Myxococcota bacterium]
MALLIFFFLNIHAQTGDTFTTVTGDTSITIPMLEGFKLADKEVEKQMSRIFTTHKAKFVHMMTNDKFNCVLLKFPGGRLSDKEFVRDMKKLKFIYNTVIGTGLQNLLTKEIEKKVESQTGESVPKYQSRLVKSRKISDRHFSYISHTEIIDSNQDNNDSETTSYTVQSILNLAGYMFILNCYVDSNYQPFEVLMENWGTSALNKNDEPPDKTIDNIEAIAQIIGYIVLGVLALWFVLKKKKRAK